MLVVNATTYYFNITQANAGNPKWEVFHNIPQAYGIPDMSPSSLFEYAQRVLNSEEEALKLEYFNAKGGPGGIRDSCSESCRRGKYCDMAFSHTDDERKCGHDDSVYRQTVPYGFMKEEDLKALGNFNKDDFFETMADPWIQRKINTEL